MRSVCSNGRREGETTTYFKRGIPGRGSYILDAAALYELTLYPQIDTPTGVRNMSDCLQPPKQVLGKRKSEEDLGKARAEKKAKEEEEEEEEEEEKEKKEEIELP